MFAEDRDQWETALPFYCMNCRRDVGEGWRWLKTPPVCGECGLRLIPSAWLIKWYTHKPGYWEPIYP